MRRGVRIATAPAELRNDSRTFAERFFINNSIQKTDCRKSDSPFSFRLFVRFRTNSDYQYKRTVRLRLEREIEIAAGAIAVADSDNVGGVEHYDFIARYFVLHIIKTPFDRSFYFGFVLTAFD